MTTPVQLTFTVPPGWVGTEYGSVCPFNQDNSRILLIKQDHFGLYDGQGQFLRDLPIGASQEPRWSRQNPNMVYFVGVDSSDNTGFPNALLSMDVSIPSIVKVVREFKEYIAISGKGESDISRDGDHFVFAGTRLDKIEEVFVYGISQDYKSPVSVQPESVDGLKITASNLAVISKASGIYVDDVGVRMLARTDGHAAVGRDTNGDDILVYTSNIDNGIYRVRIADGARTLLYTPDWSLAVDVSCSDDNGVFVSTYGLDLNFPGQVLKIALDGKSAEVVCETHSRQIPKPGGGIYYNPQPKASVSRDGSRVVFCSNNGHTEDPNYCDMWMVVMDSKPTMIPISNLTFPGFKRLPLTTGSWLFRSSSTGNMKMFANPTVMADGDKINYSTMVGKRWLLVGDVDGDLQMYEES